MADRNVLVFESMELEGSAGPVEIDILIEFYINGHLYRTAIECRGQGRKQARPWIDELIGKVADRKLKIDKCIAVSESGFTRGALQRAAGAHIETLSLKEAENRDWSLLSRLPGLVQITSEVTPEIFELGFGFEEPDEVETAFAGHPLEYRRGNFNIRSTIPDVAGVCTAREFAGKFLLLPNFLSQHLDDSSRAHGRLTIKLSLKPGTTFALDPLGGFHQLLEFSIGVWIDRTISSVPVRQYEMGLSKFGSVTGELQLWAHYYGSRQF
ncbi:MAG: hypothetical protein KIS61_23115 [Candidatus Eremiobacteraeota bacterium]|nr:hypothetical protein [Candidatus Eremiobacteraeota bacterium]